jgi:hypothetical protein
VTLEKEEIFSDDGVFLGFRDFPAPVLATLGVGLIADYPSYVAGEVADGRLADFEQAAADLGILFMVHPEWDVISMNGYTFPSSGPPEGLPPDLQIAGFDGDTGLYLVQLRAPLAAEWWARLTAVAEVVGYYPWNTYLLRIPPVALAALRTLGMVQHISPYQPAYKISPSIPDTDQPVKVVVELDAEQDLTEITALLASYGGSGADVLRARSRGFVQVAVDRARLHTLARRTEVLWMEPQYGIEPSGEREATIVDGQYDGNSPPQQPVRYPGDPGGHEGWLLTKGFCTPTGGQEGCMYYWTKVGVFDTGLDTTICLEEDYDQDTGVCSDWVLERHPDLDHNSNLQENCPEAGEGIEANEDCDGPVIYERVFCSRGTLNSIEVNQCLVADPPQYDFSDKLSDTGEDDGHGTSVASIIVGYPLDDPEPEVDDSGYYLGSGIAPSAQIVVATTLRGIAVHQGDQQGKMTHSKWSDLVAQVNTAGHSTPQWLGAVRFASNSWNLHNHYNNLEEPNYTLFSQMADFLVRDANGDSSDGLQEMTVVFSAGNCPVGEEDCPTYSPGNAKNVISVGAARGWSETYSVAHGECPGVQHHISDIAGFVQPNGNPGQNSRRRFDTEQEPWPRFKPDLVAPGSQVAAARKRYGTPPPSDPYRCFDGTSAAAPAVTASAVLIETWYWHSFGQVLPSPAMIKALLVAHADDLASAVDRLTGQPLLHSPSPAQGWGRVNLDTLIPDNSPPPSLPVAVFDQDHLSAGRRFTQSGQNWSVQLQVADPGQDIIAVMVFTDAPSEAGETSLVVNDLDLRLTKFGIGGSGRTYVGNYFAPGSWYSQNVSSTGTKVKEKRNTVEVIRVPAGAVTGSFTLRVTAAAIVGKAVPGLDGGAPNQDFALYVHNVTQ